MATGFGVLPPTRKPRPLTPPRVGSMPAIVQGVPGVSSGGQRGGAPNLQAQAKSQTIQRTDPLTSYQNKLKQNIQQGEQFNSQLESLRANRRPQTRTGFQSKYGLKRGTGQSFNQPGRQGAVAVSNNVGYRVQGKTGFLDPRTLSRAAGGALLISPAAARFNALDAAYRQQFGRGIGVTDSYRSYAQQVRTKAAKGRMAATPGTSVHGSGRALDLGGGINKRGSREWNWMMQNAPRFGWVNPKWAQTTKIEPWHWEFVG